VEVCARGSDQFGYRTAVEGQRIGMRSTVKSKHMVLYDQDRGGKGGMVSPALRGGNESMTDCKMGGVIWRGLVKLETSTGSTTN
jgi:hypothetical protein